MLFEKGIVVFSVLFFVSWAEENQPSDHGVSKEADQNVMNPVGAGTGNYYPRPKRGHVVGAVIHQEGNVFKGGSDDDNVGAYVKQENNIFRNNDPEGKTYKAVIYQNNHYKDHSAETDSMKLRTAHSAKPVAQNHQYVSRNQELEYRPAPIYPSNYNTDPAYSARQSFQVSPNYINVQQNGYNGPTRQARLFRAPVNRPVPQFSETTISNNVEMLKRRLEQLTIEMNALKETLVRLAKSLHLDQ